MFTRHIGNNIVIAVAIALLCGMSIRAYVSSQQQRTALQGQSASEMVRLVDSIHAALDLFMISGDADYSEIYADVLKSIPGIHDVRIIRLDGVEAFQDNETIIAVNSYTGEDEFILRGNEKATRVLAEDDAHLVQVLQSGMTMTFDSLSESGEHIQTFLAPLDNERRCHNCHGKTKELLGIIKLTMSLETRNSLVDSLLHSSSLLDLATAALILLIIWLFIRIIIINRIKPLSVAMAWAAEGELAELTVTGQDELSEITTTFNRMITELKSTQEGLANEQAQLSTIIQSAREGIIATNSKREVVLVNTEAQNILEKTWDEIADSGFLNIMDDPERMEQILADDDTTGAPVELSYHDKILTLQASTIKAQDGRVMGSAALFKDITNGKRLDAELQERMNDVQEANLIIQHQSERMEQELRFGHDIQQSLLSRDFIDPPENRGISLYAGMYAATEVGGDFYEFFFQDQDHICFCVGDVSGKGVPAALFMAITKSLIRSRASYDLSTSSILTHINAELEVHNESMMFVTIFLCVLNIRTGHLHFTNAGHNPVYLIKADGSLTLFDKIDGAAAGVIPDLVYTEQDHDLEKGDRLVIYTDGITEAINVKQELFGAERLTRYLSDNEFSSCKDVVNGVMDIVGEFELGNQQSDDITMLCPQLHNEPSGFSDNVFHIEIENNIKELDKVFAWTASLSEEGKISRDDYFNLDLVFDELLNNIISYGYQDNDDERHLISVKLINLENRVVATIIDDGKAFNPLLKEDSDTSLSLEDREIGGLGLQIVRQVLDHVSYKRTLNKNQMTLVKYKAKNNEDDNEDNNEDDKASVAGSDKQTSKTV